MNPSLLVDYQVIVFYLGKANGVIVQILYDVPQYMRTHCNIVAYDAITADIACVGTNILTSVSKHEANVELVAVVIILHR